MSEKCILIVDDNDDVLLYLNLVINKRKIKTICASNGKDALDLFNYNKDHIPLILMDISLPDMYGYEIASEILKIKNVNIVIQSAYAFGEEREKALTCGCVDYVTKPFKIEILNKIIDKYFFI